MSIQQTPPPGFRIAKPGEVIPEGYMFFDSSETMGGPDKWATGYPGLVGMRVLHATIAVPVTVEAGR